MLSISGSPVTLAIGRDGYVLRSGNIRRQGIALPDKASTVMTQRRKQ